MAELRGSGFCVCMCVCMYVVFRVSFGIAGALPVKLHTVCHDEVSLRLGGATPIQCSKSLVS